MSYNAASFQPCDVWFLTFTPRAFGGGGGEGVCDPVYVEMG